MNEPVRYPATARAKPGARVFIVQETPHNVLAAADFGELVFMLPAGANVTYNAQPTARHLRSIMRDVGPNDYILPTGDPVAIMIAGTVMAERTGGWLNVLKFDRQNRRYLNVRVDIFDRDVAQAG